MQLVHEQMILQYQTKGAMLLTDWACLARQKRERSYSCCVVSSFGPIAVHFYVYSGQYEQSALHPDNYRKSLFMTP